MDERSRLASGEAIEAKRTCPVRRRAQRTGRLGMRRIPVPATALRFDIPDTTGFVHRIEWNWNL